MLTIKDYSDFEDCALLCEAAKLSGEAALRYFGTDVKTWPKPGNSIVSEADFAVDEILKNYLLKARPNYGWISEESPEKKPKEGSNRTFIIDPIDGTRGFLAKKPIWCISLAIVEDGSVKVGVLYVPVLKELFKAYKGGGCYLNELMIRRDVSKAGASFYFSGPEDFMKSLPNPLQNKIERRQALPSLAYNLVLFAKNELDFLLSAKNCYEWDVAAVDILLQEAGQDLLNIDNEKIRYGVGDHRQKFLCLAPKNEQLAFSQFAKKFYHID